MKIISICGSPRKGNSETIINRIKQLFKKKGVKNEIILLREKNIQRCRGCVEYCNRNLKCHHKDDMAVIMKKILKADGYVFVLPNYFGMPPSLFKDFIDKCSIFYTSYYYTEKPDLKSKRAAVISVGTDLPCIKENVRNVAKNFCEALRIKVVAEGTFISKSELKGNYNDIFENKLNPNIKNKIERIVDKLYQSLNR